MNDCKFKNRFDINAAWMNRKGKLICLIRHSLLNNIAVEKHQWDENKED